MTAQDDSKVFEKSPVDRARLMSNYRVVYESRIFMAIFAGIVSGILGFTTYAGFIMYAIVSAITSVLLMHHMGYKHEKLLGSTRSIWAHGVGGGLMSFILFWTVFYDIVHIY